LSRVTRFQTVVLSLFNVMSLSRVARLVASAELLLVLALAPLAIFATPWRLSVLLAVVPVIWLCARLTGGRLVPRTPVNGALWLMLGMVGVSLCVTFDVRQSVAKVSGVLLGVVIFWAITRSVTTPGRLKTCTGAYLIAGAGLAAAGLLAAPPDFSGVSLPWLRRLVLTFGGADVHPNLVAGCLVLFVPLQIALLAAGADRWWGPRRSGRFSPVVWLVVFQLVLLCLTMGTLVLMRSRGAWAGLAVATVAFLAWHGRRARVAATVVGTALVLAMTMTSARSLLDSRTFSKSGSTLLDSASIRVELWSRAIQGVRDYPLTGMGMNTFRKVMPVRYPLSPPPAYPNPDLAHAHNNFLQAALDLGIPGLVSYLSLWLVALVLLVATYRHSGERIYRMIAGGLGAGLIAHFVFGLTDAVPLGSKLGVLFWFTLALTVALHYTALARQSEPRVRQ
jgi:O-antigen ligase